LPFSISWVTMKVYLWTLSEIFLVFAENDYTIFVEWLPLPEHIAFFYKYITSVSAYCLPPVAFF
jgi:hypothetical protein